MTMSRVIGFDAFAKELSTMEDQVKDDMYKCLADSAREIQQKAKRRVPVEHGDLKDSIVLQENKKGMSIKIEAAYPKSGRRIKRGSAKAAAGAKVYYALAVEYGTRHQKAQPFLMPAFEAEEEALVKKTSIAMEALLNGTR